MDTVASSLFRISVLTLFASLSTGAPTTARSVSNIAPEVDTNPVGPQYTAYLPEGTSVQGWLSGTANNDGKGTTWEANFTNLPSTGGPFLWHIHALPVPANGNCIATGAHLDPFNAGDTAPCNSTQPAACQVGDFAGKYGSITQDPFFLPFDDLFASTDPNNVAFFGNLSLVVHFANKTRIACANFALEPSDDSCPAPSGGGDDGGDDSDDESGDDGDDDDGDDGGNEKRDDEENDDEGDGVDDGVDEEEVEDDAEDVEHD